MEVVIINKYKEKRFADLLQGTLLIALLVGSLEAGRQLA